MGREASSAAGVGPRRKKGGEGEEGARPKREIFVKGGNGKGGGQVVNFLQRGKAVLVESTTGNTKGENQGEKNWNVKWGNQRKESRPSTAGHQGKTREKKLRHRDPRRKKGKGG